MKLLGEWLRSECMIQDEDLLHPDPKEELQFICAVAEGNLSYIRNELKSQNYAQKAYTGTLSKDPVMQVKYLFAIRTGLVARMCYEHGLEHERSFRINDFYIRKLDYSYTVGDVVALYKRMCMDYVFLMKRLRQRPALSRPVNDCLNYIYSHLRERITIEDLAEYTNSSASYISRLFKEDLGVSTSDYIRSTKIEAAKNMLRYSNYSLIDIANYLAFSSQSHFIQLFQKETGMTPKKYRETYYATYWKGNSFYNKMLDGALVV